MNWEQAEEDFDKSVRLANAVGWRVFPDGSRSATITIGSMYRIPIDYHNTLYSSHYLHFAWLLFCEFVKLVKEGGVEWGRHYLWDRLDTYAEYPYSFQRTMLDTVLELLESPKYEKVGG